jgi:glycosyltransferase 2 family protein
MAAETIVQEKSLNPRKLLWRGISLLIAFGLIGLMLSLIDWSAFWDVLSRLSPTSLIAVFLVYMLLNFFRSLRYTALLDRDDTPLCIVYPIALYHNFLVRLLPFKLGEFAYIVLMRNRLNIPVKEGVSSLLGSRLLELLIVILVFAVSLLLSGGMMANQQTLAVVLGVGSIIGGVVSFYYMGLIIRAVTAMMHRLINLKPVQSLADKLDSLAAEFDRIRHPRIFTTALVWSFFTYACSFSVNAILLWAVGLDVSPTTWIVLVSLGMFATGVPFNISGFGAVELSWTFGLTTYAGYSTGEAASIGLMLNGYQLICAALSGLIGYAVYLLQNRKG